MNQDAIQLTRLTTIEPPTAVQKPAIVKPGSISATSPSMAALITSRNNPTVSSSAGSDSTHGDGPHDGVHHAQQQPGEDERRAAMSMTMPLEAFRLRPRGRARRPGRARMKPAMTQYLGGGCSWSRPFSRNTLSRVSASSQ